MDRRSRRYELADRVCQVGAVLEPSGCHPGRPALDHLRILTTRLTPLRRLAVAPRSGAAASRVRVEPVASTHSSAHEVRARRTSATSTVPSGSGPNAAGRRGGSRPSAGRPAQDRLHADVWNAAPPGEAAAPRGSPVTGRSGSPSRARACCNTSSTR